MQRLVYLLSYPFLWIVSILPFRLFYAFSDVVFFLLYHVVGYRKSVVWSNLLLTFPEKDPAELRQIRIRFYRHMVDMFLEMVKTMNMDKADLKKHYHITNIELLRELEQTKSVLIACAHYANWEWNVSINNYVNSKGYVIYQKVSNKYFDALIKRIRSKWGTTPITQQETVRTVMRNEKEGIRGIYGIVSDQSPMAHRAQYWSKFMGITVPIYNGPEVLARKLDLAVVFGRVTKVKRGYYSLEMIPITRNGSATAEGEITEKFLRLTEDLIRQEPAHYLWTHRRWKHRNKAPKAMGNKISGARTG